MNREPNTRLLRGVILALVLGCAVVGPMPIHAQDLSDDVLREVQKAITRGDAEGLSRHLEPRVDVSIFGVQTLYSRAQTEYVMRAFFRDHPPEQFVLQRAEEEKGTWLATGRYWNRGDAHPYRVTLLLRQRSGDVLIRSIRIEHVRP